MCLRSTRLPTCEDTPVLYAVPAVHKLKPEVPSQAITPQIYTQAALVPLEPGI